MKVHLEVVTEVNVVKQGLAGDVSYMVDTTILTPFRSVVEKIQCNRLVRPRFGMCEAFDILLSPGKSREGTGLPHAQFIGY